MILQDGPGSNAAGRPRLAGLLTAPPLMRGASAPVDGSLAAKTPRPRAGSRAGAVRLHAKRVTSDDALSLLRLADSVQQIPPRPWLLSLAREVGFEEGDLRAVAHKRHIHLVETAVHPAVRAQQRLGSSDASEARSHSQRKSRYRVGAAEATVRAGSPSHGAATAVAESDAESTASSDNTELAFGSPRVRGGRRRKLTTSHSVAITVDARGSRRSGTNGSPGLRAPGSGRTISIGGAGWSAPAPESNNTLMVASSANQLRRLSHRTVPWLRPSMTSTVIRDKRANRLHMVSQGTPQAVVGNCTDYWDGKGIWPITPARRRELLETFQQWRSEGLYIVAFAYDPVNKQQSDVFRILDLAAQEQHERAAREREQQRLAALQRAREASSRSAGRRAVGGIPPLSAVGPLTGSDPSVARNSAGTGVRGAPTPGSVPTSAAAPPPLHLDVGLAITSTAVFLLDHPTRGRPPAAKTVASSEEAKRTSSGASDGKGRTRSSHRAGRNRVVDGGSSAPVARGGSADPATRPHKDDRRSTCTPSPSASGGESLRPLSQRSRTEGSDAPASLRGPAAPLAHDHAADRTLTTPGTRAETTDPAASKAGASHAGPKEVAGLLTPPLRRSRSRDERLTDERLIGTLVRIHRRPNEPIPADYPTLVGNPVGLHGSSSPPHPQMDLVASLAASPTPTATPTPTPSLRDPAPALADALRVGHPPTLDPSFSAASPIPPPLEAAYSSGSGNPLSVSASVPSVPSLVPQQDRFSAALENVMRRMQQGQIFLGLVAGRYQPKPMMQSIIDALKTSGVRFVFTSSRSYARAKPLADKMGLETGWNCAISLAPRKQSRELMTAQLQTGPAPVELFPDKYTHKRARVREGLPLPPDGADPNSVTGGVSSLALASTPGSAAFVAKEGALGSVGGSARLRAGPSSDLGSVEESRGAGARAESAASTVGAGALIRASGSAKPESDASRSKRRSKSGKRRGASRSREGRSGSSGVGSQSSHGSHSSRSGGASASAGGGAPGASSAAGHGAASLVASHDRGDDNEWAEAAGMLTPERRRQLLVAGVDRQEWDLKAQLPHGIAEIRRHLEEKDDVPLLVSLFTDSTPLTVGGMMRVMQENGEVVCLVATALRRASPMLFRIGDSAIGLLPPHPSPLALFLPSTPSFRRELGDGSPLPRPAAELFWATGGHRHASPPPHAPHPSPPHGAVHGSGASTGPSPAIPPPNPFVRLSSALSTLHCALALPPTSGMHVLLKATADARRGSYAFTQAVAFLLLAETGLSAAALALSATGLPLGLPTPLYAWLAWIVAPVLALSLLFAPAPAALMTPRRTPYKRGDGVSRFREIIPPEEGAHLLQEAYGSLMVDSDDEDAEEGEGGLVGEAAREGEEHDGAGGGAAATQVRDDQDAGEREEGAVDDARVEGREGGIAEFGGGAEGSQNNASRLKRKDEAREEDSAAAVAVRAWGGPEGVSPDSAPASQRRLLRARSSEHSGLGGGGGEARRGRALSDAFVSLADEADENDEDDDVVEEVRDDGVHPPRLRVRADAYDDDDDDADAGDAEEGEARTATAAAAAAAVAAAEDELGSSAHFAENGHPSESTELEIAPESLLRFGPLVGVASLLATHLTQIPAACAELDAAGSPDAEGRGGRRVPRSAAGAIAYERAISGEEADDEAEGEEDTTFIPDRLRREDPRPAPWPKELGRIVGYSTVAIVPVALLVTALYLACLHSSPAFGAGFYAGRFPAVPVGVHPGVSEPLRAHDPYNVSAGWGDESENRTGSAPRVWGESDPSSLSAPPLSAAQEDAVAAARALVALVLELWLVQLSGFSMHRGLAMREEPPWRNEVWVAAVVGLTMVQCAVSVLLGFWGGPGRRIFVALDLVPWGVWLAVGAWQPVSAFILAFAKDGDSVEFIRRAQQRWALFNTRLGMHSPR